MSFGFSVQGQGPTRRIDFWNTEPMRYMMAVPAEIVIDGITDPYYLYDYTSYLGFYQRRRIMYLRRKRMWDKLPEEYKHKNIAIIR